MFLKFINPLLYFGLLTNLVMVNALTDCDILSLLYKSFQAESKITWPDNSTKCCSLKGITCKNERITEIDLQRQEFKGKIGDEICRLSELQTIDLRYNNITGAIPDSIASLPKLEYLNLSENGSLNSKITKSICFLSNLKGFFAYNNLLYGDIPECIGNLSNLEELCLDNNKLIGFIPESIGKLKNLKHLNLENNQLSGTLPDSLAKLDKLENFKVKGNKDLIGYLPEIQNLKDCSYANTNLCVKENSHVCSNDLRQCTPYDLQKVAEFNKILNDYNKNNSNNDKKKKSGGMSGIVIAFFLLLVIALIAAFLLYKRFKKNKTKDTNAIRNNTLSTNNSTFPKHEKSFVVLSPKDDDSLPPKLTLDDSLFSYVDVKEYTKDNESNKNNSKSSADIKTQEQYEKRIQYQNFLSNQNYYLD